MSENNKGGFLRAIALRKKDNGKKILAFKMTERFAIIPCSFMFKDLFVPGDEGRRGSCMKRGCSHER